MRISYSNFYTAARGREAVDVYAKVKGMGRRCIGDIIRYGQRWEGHLDCLPADNRHTGSKTYEEAQKWIESYRPEIQAWVEKS